MYRQAAQRVWERGGEAPWGFVGLGGRWAAGRSIGFVPRGLDIRAGRTGGGAASKG